MVLEAHRVRCTRQSAENAKRNVKFLSSPEKTVRSIARIASRSARMPAAAKSDRKVLRTEYGDHSLYSVFFYESRYPIRLTALAIRARAIPTVFPSVRLFIKIAA